MQYAYKPGELERLKKTELEIFAAFVAICEKYDLPYFLNGGTAIGAVRHQGFIPWDDDMDVGLLREDYETFLRVAPGEIAGKYELMNAEINRNCPGYTLRMCKIGTKHITDEHDKYPVNFGIRLDIFPYDNVPEDPKLRRKQLRDINLYNRMYILRTIRNPEVPLKGIAGKVMAAGCFVAHYLLKAFVSVDFINRKYRETSLRYHNKTSLVTSLCDLKPEDWMVKKEDIFPLQDVIFEGMTVKVMACNHEMLTRGFGDYMQLPPESQRYNHGAKVLDFGDGQEGKETL